MALIGHIFCLLTSTMFRLCELQCYVAAAAIKNAISAEKICQLRDNLINQLCGIDGLAALTHNCIITVLPGGFREYAKTRLQLALEGPGCAISFITSQQPPHQHQHRPQTNSWIRSTVPVQGKFIDKTFGQPSKIA